MSSPCPAREANPARASLRWFLALALVSALLNSSAPTPLYPHYQQTLALSSVSLTLIYGGYAGAYSSLCWGSATWLAG